MIKKTLCFSSPAYLSLGNAQLVIRLPEVENNETLPQRIKAVCWKLEVDRLGNIIRVIK